VVAILPGSRSSEVQYLARRFLQAARLIQAARPGARFVLPAVGALRAVIEEAARGAGLGDSLQIVTGQSHTVLAACDVTLIASGTATLEAALFKRPMVIAYNMNWLSWQIMRRKKLQPWVGLPNILCGDFVVPELLQGAATPQAMAHAVLAWLDAPERIIGSCSGASRRCTMNCNATPQHWQPMRSRKFLKAEQAALAWDMPGLVAGVDEAGRGPLAGPVVAAAVILDDLNPMRGLADSKTLTALRREKLYDEIRAKALCCSIGEASVDEIDTLNILEATMLAMRRAVEGLRLKPVKVLVDGNRLPRLDVLAEAIVKGDAKVRPFQLPPFWPRCTATAGALNSTSSTRSTGLTATRATEPQSTWRRCARMAPARSTANRSRLSRRC
jgi:hypothetical protein